MIAYGSRTYNKAEVNYCTTRKDLLAVVYFVKQFKQYLLGRKFLVRTNYAALTWLQRTSEMIGQQVRWQERLQEFSFTIQHRREPSMAMPTRCRGGCAVGRVVVCLRRRSMNPRLRRPACLERTH